MKKYPTLFFLISLAAIALYYNYQEIIFRQPQSIHAWRQSDCASIALNYYQNGMHFFSPETHNLTSDGGTSSKCCTSEIPILYYIVALFYNLFGHHDSIFRLFNTLLFFLGLFYLFRIFRYILKDTFWAICLSLLFFSSPVLAYYGNNYLSNSSALAFVFIGWHYFFRYINERENRWFYISIAVFLLAGSFKVTALFSLLAIAGIILIELFRITKFDGEKNLFQHPWKFLLLITSVLIIIGGWIVYASWFNKQHDCTYFSTTTFPVWNLNKEGIASVLRNIKVIWLDHYFHPSALIFLLACTLFILFRIKKSNKVISFTILFIFIEVVGYVLLQFWTFKDHDYYVIDIYILLVLIVISTFDLLKREHPAIFNSFIAKCLFAFFLLFNIYHAEQKLEERYYSMNNYFQQEDIYSLEPHLRKMGILSTDKVISIPDASHVSLYLMNQHGWTEYTDAKYNRGEKIRYNQDSTGIALSIQRGAKYLIVNGIKELYFKPYLQPFSTHLVGQHGRVLVFDLKNSEKNFTLQEREIKQKISCSAEKVTEDGVAFLGTPDTVLFRNGETQNSDFVFSGQYSVKLDENRPYGMTIQLGDVKVDESFNITVWRKADSNSNSSIIASAINPDCFYYGKTKIVESLANGWEKLEMEFFIQKELPSNEMAIYLLNPEKEPVWFDDLEIIHYGNNY